MHTGSTETNRGKYRYIKYAVRDNTHTVVEEGQLVDLEELNDLMFRGPQKLVAKSSVHAVGDITRSAHEHR